MCRRKSASGREVVEKTPGKSTRWRSERSGQSFKVAKNAAVSPRHYAVEPRLLSFGNPFKCYEEVVYLEPIAMTLEKIRLQLNILRNHKGQVRTLDVRYYRILR